MAHINQSPPDFENFVIRSCTNTGVWIVEQQNTDTGQIMAVYDFVNKEYTGPETAGEPTSYDFLNDEQKTYLVSLQKSLNKALLD